MSTSVEFGTVAVYEAMADLLNNDPAWAEKGKSINYSMVFDYGSPVGKSFFVRFADGKVFDVKELPGSDAEPADFTHWLTSGFEEQRITALLEGSTFLTLSKEGANVAVFPKSGRMHRAGFVWPENTERLLRNSSLLIAEPTELAMSTRQVLMSSSSSR